MEGMCQESVKRDVNVLIWHFSRTASSYEEIEYIKGFIGHSHVITLIEQPALILEKGNKLEITYRLKWWWKGDNETYNHSPVPVPGAKLHFSLSA
jgi:hypothetical protein